MATSPLPYDTFLYEKVDALHGFSVLATEIPVKSCLTVYPGLYPIPVSSLSFYRQYAEQITRAMKDYGISKAVLRRHDLYMANEPGVHEGPPYLLRISWRRLNNGEMTVEEHVRAEYRGKLRKIQQDGYGWCPVEVYRRGRSARGMTPAQLEALPPSDGAISAVLWIRWRSHLADYPYVHPDDGLTLSDEDITFEICTAPPEALVRQYTPGIDPGAWVAFMNATV